MRLQVVRSGGAPNVEVVDGFLIVRGPGDELLVERAVLRWLRSTVRAEVVEIVARYQPRWGFKWAKLEYGR